MEDVVSFGKFQALFNGLKNLRQSSDSSNSIRQIDVLLNDWFEVGNQLERRLISKCVIDTS